MTRDDNYPSNGAGQLTDFPRQRESPCSSANDGETSFEKISSSPSFPPSLPQLPSSTFFTTSDLAAKPRLVCPVEPVPTKPSRTRESAS